MEEKKEQPKQGAKFTPQDLQQLYTNRANYEQRKTIDFRSKAEQDHLGLVFFNGLFARNCLSANAENKSLVIAALNDAGMFGRPVSPPYFLTKDKKGIIVVDLKGEVVIIKTDKTGKPIKKLIVSPTVAQVAEVNKPHVSLK